MDLFGTLNRRLKLTGWHVEIVMLGVALLIAILPSIVILKARTRTQARPSGMEKVSPGARLYTLSAGVPDDVQLPTSPEWIVFSMDVEKTGTTGSYRVAIVGSQGREIWQASGLSSSGAGKLVFVVASSLIPPGNYTISVSNGSKPSEPMPGRYYAIRASN